MRRLKYGMEQEARARTVQIISMCCIVLLASALASCGCISKVTSGSHAEATPETSPLPVPPITENQSAHLVATVNPEVAMTPVKSEAVIEVEPILTPDPYPVMHGTRINSTPTTDRFNRNVEFQKTYHLTGNAEGLLVNVPEGPLYIVYTVSPQNDCLTGSCKGDMTKPVQRPYMTITVRDNETHEIVAQDGYAREFSSDTGKYEWSFTSKSTMDSLLSSASYADETITSSPGPRYIPIYKEGTFHITIEGEYIDADLKILAGPTLESIPESIPGATSPSEIPPEEMFG